MEKIYYSKIEPYIKDDVKFTSILSHLSNKDYGLCYK